MKTIFLNFLAILLLCFSSCSNHEREIEQLNSIALKTNLQIKELNKHIKNKIKAEYQLDPNKMREIYNVHVYLDKLTSQTEEKLNQILVETKASKSKYKLLMSSYSNSIDSLVGVHKLTKQLESKRLSNSLPEYFESSPILSFNFVKCALHQNEFDILRILENNLPSYCGFYPDINYSVQQVETSVPITQLTLHSDFIQNHSKRFIVVDTLLRNNSPCPFEYDMHLDYSIGNVSFENLSPGNYEAKGKIYVIMNASKSTSFPFNHSFTIQ